jgi:hypothetical protein
VNGLFIVDRFNVLVESERATLLGWLLSFIDIKLSSEDFI